MSSTPGPLEKEMLTEQTATYTCCHHWIIQPAEGPVSDGVCKLCHATREFKNSLDAWGDDRAVPARLVTVATDELPEGE